MCQALERMSEYRFRDFTREVTSPTSRPQISTKSTKDHHNKAESHRSSHRDVPTRANVAKKNGPDDSVTAARSGARQAMTVHKMTQYNNQA